MSFAGNRLAAVSIGDDEDVATWTAATGSWVGAHPERKRAKATNRTAHRALRIGVPSEFFRAVGMAEPPQPRAMI
jgi:hypothetical protein